MPMVQAHRGASAYAPENTLPAFALAVEMEADGVENDIHYTLDGQFVVCHDSNIARTSDGTGEIHEMTLKQLREYDFGKKFDPKFAGTVIPTLKEFLDVVKDMRVINIEVKPPYPDHVQRGVIYDQLYRELAEAGCTERTIISSFDHGMLKELKAAHPDLRTALLYGHPMTPEETLEFVHRYDADIVHPFIGCIDENIVNTCLENGIDVNVWTVDDPENIRRAIDLRVTGIITNVPDKVRAML